MSVRPELSSQLNKLPPRDLAILRLKYGEGKTYKEIAGALKIEPAEVGAIIFQTLKSLDSNAGLNDPKVLGFIHGELDQSELQEMAPKIESDPVLRKEFESWLSISDDLERVLTKPSEKPSAISAEAKRSPKLFLLAGGAVLLISLAVAMLKNRGDESEAPSAPASQEASAPAAEAIPPTPSAPPPENSQPPNDASADAQNSAAAAAAAGGQNSAAEPLAMPEPRGPEPLPASDSAASDQSTAAGDSADASGKKMGVIVSKLKVSKNLNLKKVMRVLQQRLDGKPSCVPVRLAHIKSMNSVIKVLPTGAISKVESEPKSASFSKCLSKQLAGKPVGFKSANKHNGQITLALKNF